MKEREMDTHVGRKVNTMNSLYFIREAGRMY